MWRVCVCVCLSSYVHICVFMHHSSVKGARSEDKDGARQAPSSNWGTFMEANARWKCGHRSLQMPRYLGMLLAPSRCLDDWYKKVIITRVCCQNQVFPVLLWVLDRVLRFGKKTSSGQISAARRCVAFSGLSY